MQVIIMPVCEIVMLCRKSNCRTDVIQAGVRFEIEIPGCSRIGLEIPDAMCEYLTFNIMSFPASVCEYMASCIHLSVKMPTSVQRLMQPSPSSSSGLYLISDGSFDKLMLPCGSGVDAIPLR